MPASTYAEKLRDPRWQKKRLEIFERDGWHCRRCGDSESTLHCHHMRYDRGGEPWDSPSEDLITLCESCHEGETSTRQEYEDTLLAALRLRGFFAGDIWNIMEAILHQQCGYPNEVFATALRATFSNSNMTKVFMENYFSHLKERVGRNEQQTGEKADGVK